MWYGGQNENAKARKGLLWRRFTGAVSKYCFKWRQICLEGDEWERCSLDIRITLMSRKDGAWLSAKRRWVPGTYNIWNMNYNENVKSTLFYPFLGRMFGVCSEKCLPGWREGTETNSWVTRVEWIQTVWISCRFHNC